MTPYPIGNMVYQNIIDRGAAIGTGKGKNIFHGISLMDLKNTQKLAEQAYLKNFYRLGTKL